jgi:hypothetical protein
MKFGRPTSFSLDLWQAGLIQMPEARTLPKAFKPLVGRCDLRRHDERFASRLPFRQVSIGIR